MQPTDRSVSRRKALTLAASGAAAVAALLAGIQALVHGMELWLGRGGLIAGTLLAALADLHSALAAAFLSAGPATGPDATVRPLSDPAVFARFDPFFRQGQGPAVLDLSAEGWLLFGTRTGASGTAASRWLAMKSDGRSQNSIGGSNSTAERNR